MICEHLRVLDEALKAKGFKETYRGQAWSKECREWVYFGGRGQEAGFFCTVHKDGVVGLHPKHDPRSPVLVFPCE